MFDEETNRRLFFYQVTLKPTVFLVLMTVFLRLKLLLKNDSISVVLKSITVTTLAARLFREL